MTKIISAMFACALAGVVVCWGALHVWLKPEQLAAWIAHVASRELGIPVTAGRASVGWPLGLTIRDVAIGDPAERENQQHLEKVHIAFSPRRLFYGKIWPTGVEIDGMQATAAVSTHGPACDPWGALRRAVKALPAPLPFSVSHGTLAILPQALTLQKAVYIKDISGELYAAPDLTANLTGNASIQGVGAGGTLAATKLAVHYSLLEDSGRLSLQIHQAPLQTLAQILPGDWQKKLGLESGTGGAYLHASFGADHQYRLTAEVQVDGVRIVPADQPWMINDLQTQLVASPHGITITGTTFTPSWKTNAPAGAPVNMGAVSIPVVHLDRAANGDVTGGAKLVMQSPRETIPLDFVVHEPFQMDKLTASLRLAQINVACFSNGIAGVVPIAVEISHGIPGRTPDRNPTTDWHITGTVPLAGISAGHPAGNGPNPLQLDEGTAQIVDSAVALTGVRARLRLPAGAELPVAVPSAQLSYANQRLEIREAHGSGAGATVEATGHVDDLLGSPQLALSMTVHDLNYHELEPFVPDRFRLPVGGESHLVADATGTVSGPAQQPVLRFEVKPHRGTVAVKAAGRTVSLALLPEGDILATPPTATVRGMELELNGSKAHIQGTIDGRGGRTAVQMTARVEPLKIESLIAMAGEPPAARVAGTLRHPVDVTIRGSTDHLSIQSHLDVTGLTVRPGGGGEPVEFESGTVALAGTEARLEGIHARYCGIPLTISGTAREAHGPPSIDLRVHDADLDVARLQSRSLTQAGVSIAGHTQLDLAIRGTATHPEVSGRVPLTGITLRTDRLRDPVRMESGAVELSGTTARLDQVRAIVAGAATVVTGNAVDLLGQTRISIRATGSVPLAPFASSARITGVLRYRVDATGAASHPEIAGSLAADPVSVVLPNGRNLSARNVQAHVTLAGQKPSLIVDNVDFAGGRITGVVTVPPRAGAPPQISMRLYGGDLAELWRQTVGTAAEVSGPCSATFVGTVPAQLGDLTGTGYVRSEKMAVDLSKDPQLASYQRMAQEGRVAGTVAGGILRSNVLLAGLGSSAAGEANYYAQIVNAARARHDLGTVAAQVRAASGYVTLYPLGGPSMRGWLRVGLTNNSLSGQITRLDLARLHLKDIKIAGTISAPVPTIAMNNVHLDGAQKPGSGTSLANSAGEMLLGGPVGALGAPLLPGGGPVGWVGGLFGHHKHKKEQPAPAATSSGSQPSP